MFVNYHAWQYAGSDTLWAGIVTKLSDAIEKEFGTVCVRIFRILQARINLSMTNAHIVELVDCFALSGPDADRLYVLWGDDWLACSPVFICLLQGYLDSGGIAYCIIIVFFKSLIAFPSREQYDEKSVCDVIL